MLNQVACHGLIDLHIVAEGDRHIDDHHTVEDLGITLGQAINRAAGDKAWYNALWSCLRASG